MRKLRLLVNAALASMVKGFAVYARTGRPSAQPERLLKAMLLQIPFTFRSERRMIKGVDDNLFYHVRAADHR